MTGQRALGHEGTGHPWTETEEKLTTHRKVPLGQPPACGEQKGEATVGRGRNVSWCPSTAGSHVASLGQGQQHRQTSNQRVEGETQSIWLLQITASRKLLSMSISRTKARMQAAILPSVPSICQVSVTCREPLKVKPSNPRTTLTNTYEQFTVSGLSDVLSPANLMRTTRKCAFKTFCFAGE